MSAQVRHNGTNITGAVVSYERTHNICTSVGILTVEIVGNIGRTFDPWDSIDIYENGDFKVRYYISSVNHTNPKGIITLQCQDISKKLVDYFIPDTYTIETPTYTRPWIEQFLDEVGLEYEFTTASQGVLMSNFTQLGLVSAYEQLLTLLQMSGWYMYFDGTEKAIIGSLSIDFADDIGSVGKTDILEIKKISDDRMLRNRALVIGAYDPFRGTQAAADISVHTPWNYDHRDIRTVVISNSNIPDNESAYGMANMLVKEFARITVEKHITVHGFRDFNLGTALRVTSNVWRGRGLVTTFGTSMSKQGFVTNVVLDERCPRLFGFFDFGDYVYVGTYGEGVWRKHIKFDPTWYDFSNGLTNLNITDLHINQGIFGAVAASGEAYYAIDNVPWNQITLSSLWSSSEDQVEVTESGIPASGLDMIPFSGLMARATIVDKLNGFLRFGIDNYSGINTGDYFITESGNLTASGITSSGNRGWVVEYDVLNGNLAGTSYPISLSGNYNFMVLDLDNDGKNDYVSVATIGDGITGDVATQQYNYGYGNGHPYPAESKTSWSTLLGSPTSTTISSSQTFYSFGVVDNVNDHEFFYTTSNTFVIRKYNADSSGQSLISSTTVNLPSGITPLGNVTPEQTGASILRPTSGVYKFIAQGNGIDYDRYVVVSITHLGSESYSVSVASVVTDSSITISGQNGRYCSVVKTDNSSFDRLIYAGLIDILSATYSLNLVYSSGGTASDRREPQVVFNVIDGTLVGSGFQREWNSSSPTSISVYPLYLEGTTMLKGSLITTGNITLTLQSQRVSRTSFVVYSTNLATNYSIYHDGTVVSGADMLFAFHPVYHTSFDSTALRVHATTKKLQYSTIPITTWNDVDLGSDTPVTGPFAYLDTVEGLLFIRTEVSGNNYIIGIDWNSKQIVSRFTRFTTSDAPNPSTVFGFNIGNFLAIVHTGLSATISAYIIRNLSPALGEGSSYMVLRREGDQFTLIEEEAYPIRVDISNNAPVLTAGSGDTTFVSNYVYDSELVVIEALSSGMPQQVNDYRYTYLEVGSGLGVEATILYITASGIFATDALTYSGGFTEMFAVPSGYGTRIETSNYGIDGQYIFITTSGEVQTFYQQDPAQFIFTEYGTGFPQSRATIIRLDDSV